MPRNPNNPKKNIGQSRTPIYQTWNSMIGRCTRPTNTNYYRYGGRGITICDRWMEFSNFVADMGPRPEGMTLDRIDSNGNYEPGNCRWADWDTQMENRDISGCLTNRKLSDDDIREIRRLLKEGSMMQKDIAELFGVGRSAITKIKKGYQWKEVL